MNLGEPVSDVQVRRDNPVERMWTYLLSDGVIVLHVSLIWKRVGDGQHYWYDKFDLLDIVVDKGRE